MDEPLKNGTAPIELDLLWTIFFFCRAGSPGDFLYDICGLLPSYWKFSVTWSEEILYSSSGWFCQFLCTIHTFFYRTLLKIYLNLIWRDIVVPADFVKFCVQYISWVPYLFFLKISVSFFLFKILIAIYARILCSVIFGGGTELTESVRCKF
jgi:hypothetical protein